MTGRAPPLPLSPPRPSSTTSTTSSSNSTTSSFFLSSSSQPSPLGLPANRKASRDSACAHHRDGFSCVRTSGCGWCAHRYTCVPGDETGPSGLPCAGNSSDVSLRRAQALDMLYREPMTPKCATDHANCSRYNGPLYTYTAEALRATGYRGVNYTTSAPEFWDVLCEAGGMRSSVVAHYADNTAYWISQGCECPTGRNGMTCMGCNSASGCAPTMFCERSFKAGPANLSCAIEQMVPDYMKILTQWYNESGVRFEYGVGAGGDVFFRIQQAVENANFAGFAHPNGGGRDHGDGDRILSGTGALFLGSETTSSSTACPAPTVDEVQFPWKDGDRCFMWVSHAGAGACASDPPPIGPGDSGNFRGDGGSRIGWSRYTSGCPLIKAQLVPPVEMICLAHEGAQLTERQSSACVIRLPSRQMSMRLHCQLQGVCVPKGSPPHAPMPPMPPSINDICGNASMSTYASCWMWLSYSVTWFLLFVGLLTPFLLRRCTRCVASLHRRRNRISDTPCCSLAGLGVYPQHRLSDSSAAPHTHSHFSRVTREPLLNTFSGPSFSLFSRQPVALTTPPPLLEALQSTHIEPAEASASVPVLLAPAAPPPMERSQTMAQPDNATRGIGMNGAEDAGCHNVDRGESRGGGRMRCDIQGDNRNLRMTCHASLSWCDLSYHIANTQILQPSTHGIQPGLHCLIGPSGSGKSSLLGILAGRKARGHVGGQVKLAGRSADASSRRLRVGYVTQEDMLPPTCTIAEHLRFHARTRAPWLSPHQRDDLVASTLAAVSLAHKATDLIGDTYVRGLSGGERRRVSLAVELLILRGSALRGIMPSCDAAEEGQLVDAGNGPQLVSSTRDGMPRNSCVLLLDEPLSGLDSVNARLVLATLCELVGQRPPQFGTDGPRTTLHTPLDNGCDANSARCHASLTVLLSVHQPTHRFLLSMSGIVVMAPGGRILYGGPTSTPSGTCALTSWFEADGVPPHLGHIAPNPAEALLEVLADTSQAMQIKIDRLIEERARSVSSHQCSCPSCRQGHITEETVVGDDKAMSSESNDSISLGESWARIPQGDRSPGFFVQLDALSARHCTVALRHPLLIWVNLVSTLIISILCGFAFWQTGKNNALDSGVLQRVGLLFFLMLIFMLSSLINIQMWHRERLLYFQESAAGCYGPLSFLLAKLLFDAIPLRVVPSLLCAAIVYPMAGLHSSGPLGPGLPATGPPAALIFATGLAMANLVGYSLVSAIAIACSSPGVSMQVSAWFALYSFLFCGLLVNKATLEQMGNHVAQEYGQLLGAAISALPLTSFMFRFIEMVLVDELGTPGVPFVDIQQRAIPGSAPYPPVHVPGPYILDFLGYNHGDEGTRHCWLGIPCAAWDDLMVLAGWFLIAQICCYLLLRFIVKDPH